MFHIQSFTKKSSLLVMITLLWPLASQAYLGSFEESDGYRVPGVGQINNIPTDPSIVADAQFYLNNLSANGFTGIVAPGTYPNTLGDARHGPDVSRYNAGMFGTGVGGTATDILDNSGQWRALAGGRLYEDRNAPVYSGGQFQRNYVAAYDYTGARTGSQVLNLLAYDRDMRYSYKLDSRDLKGINPIATSDMRIDLTFWTCPTDADDLVTGVNTVAMSFRDSIGQVLVDVGYTGDNLLQYRIGGSLVWQTTAITLGTLGWSEISVVINTGANDISLAARAFSDINTTLDPSVNVVTNQSLGFDTDNVTDIEFSAADVDGFKNFFDDFDFNTSLAPVPEPGSAVMLLIAGACMMKRRRKVVDSIS